MLSRGRPLCGDRGVGMCRLRKVEGGVWGLGRHAESCVGDATVLSYSELGSDCQRVGGAREVPTASEGRRERAPL